MGHITSSQRIAAPVEAVFAYVDDYRNTTNYMKDLTKWAPAGDKTHGQGARFEVAMKAGPLTLPSVVDITTWVENSAIGWISSEGFKQKGQWSFRADGDGTRATFDLDYELPGGIAGRLLSRASDPIVRGNIEQSVRNLKSRVERSLRRPLTPAAAAAPAEAPKPAPAPQQAAAASKRASAPKAAPAKAASPKPRAAPKSTAKSTVPGKATGPRKPNSRPKG